MTATPERHDRPIARGVAFGFALSLGIATITIPLVALAAGYDAAIAAGSGATSATSGTARRSRWPSA